MEDLAVWVSCTADLVHQCGASSHTARCKCRHARSFDAGRQEFMKVRTDSSTERVFGSPIDAAIASWSW